MKEAKASRRSFLGYAATAIVVGVIAGAGGYYAGLLGVPPATITTTRPTTVTTTRPTTVTTTRATTVTATRTVTAGAGEVVTTTITQPGETTTVTQPRTTTTVTTTLEPITIPQELVEAANKEGELLLYECDPTASVAPLISAFNETYPDITVTHYRQISGKLYEKFSAEARAGQYLADMISLMEPSALKLLKADGLIKQYAFPELRDYPDWAKEPDGYWCGSHGYGAAIAYNTKFVSDQDAPKSWKDLADPKWTGVNGMIDPRVGGGPGMQFSILTDKLGEDWHKARSATNPRVFSGNSPASAALAAGEIWLVGPCAAATYIRYYLEKDAPFKIVWPSEGTAVTFHGVALPKTSPHPNAGELWVRWYLGEECQSLVAERGFFPFRTGFAPQWCDKMPQIPKISSMSDLDTWTVDWDKLADVEIRESYYKLFEQYYLE